MSTQTRITKGVRVRGAGQAGEWLISQLAKSARHSPELRGRARRAGRPVEASDQMQILRELISTEDWQMLEEDILVVSASDSAFLEKARALFELVSERLDELDNAEMERLINAVMPTLSDRPPPAVIDQARRNAETRARFVRHYEMLDAEQVHDLYGSTAKNPAALAARWRADGKVFAVEYRGRLLYPAFQFDDQGRPKAIIGKVLAAMGNAVGPWQTATWFTTGNAWLDGRKPVDLLDVEPERLVDAARDIAEPAAH